MILTLTWDVNLDKELGFSEARQLHITMVTSEAKKIRPDVVATVFLHTVGAPQMADGVVIGFCY